MVRLQRRACTWRDNVLLVSRALNGRVEWRGSGRTRDDLEEEVFFLG